jgi:putative heme-binding domain-containing protein
LLQSGAVAPDKAQDYQAVIIAGLKLGSEKGGPAVQLLKKWTGKELPKNSDVEQSLVDYRTWYSEKFPNAPEAELPQEDVEKSKFSKQQLLDIAANSPPGDVARGKLIFAKATCIKCHRFLKDGESVGPDLTSIRRRFQKQEIIESVLFPSQVISDQYQAVTISTSEGLIFSGMPLPNSGNEKQLVMLLSDATKVVVAKDKIEDRLPSRISVMPEGLFKNLSEQEIADLFAFLETSRSNPEPVAPAKP